jgi:catechol 2,3-dioxygenase-like lactoylglutathione lyase family enzyme
MAPRPARPVAVGNVVGHSADGSAHPDLAFLLPPMKDEGGIRPASELVALRTFEVRIERESALVEAAQQHGPRVRHSADIGGRERHRVGLVHPDRDRFVVPVLKVFDGCQTGGMSFHHVAIATRDLEATHTFYSEACGFELQKVDVIPFGENGWARHLFYDTGNGELFAVWDLHSEELPDFNPAISTGLGLPNFVNHIAFGADSLDDLDARKDRWLANGHDVVRIDHGWCTSVYTDDPTGTMVEFCVLTRALTGADKAEAQQLLKETAPTVDRTDPPIEFFTARESVEA